MFLPSAAGGFLLALFLFFTAVQLFYWLFFFSRLAFYRPPLKAENSHHSVSVIICARNEAHNLQKNLIHFLNQNYRSYEVIVVNDNSSDHTPELLLDFQAKWRNLRVINLETPGFSGKKRPLAAGIGAARYDVLLLSDADCVPAGPGWLQAMQTAIGGETEIGLGYSPYRREAGVLNAFIRFEAVYTAVQYLSFALAGVPYMGVGRNLVYTKKLYRDSGGFRHPELLSGDDDLFVNAVANKRNTKVILERGAFVVSEPKSTWRGYYNQKRRHLTTGGKYRLFHRVLLGLLAASHAGHYVTALVLILSGAWTTMILLTYLVRLAVVSALYRRILDRLDDPALWKWIPLLDAGFVMYYFIFAPALLNGNVKRWK